MKIGILTFHRAYNYGAFLQCFSLQKELSKRFPQCEVYVIDYESQNMADYYKTNWFTYFFGRRNSLTNNSFLSSCKIFAVRCLSILKGKSQHKEFFSNNKLIPCFKECYKYLPLTETSLVSDNYEKATEFINSLDLDIVVVGSDAIWNDYQTNIPNIYYLNDKIKGYKLSYAASCYGMDYKKMTPEQTKYIADALKCFDFIGVRDKETAAYVNRVCPDISTVHTCDPSLLLDLADLPINRADVEKKLANAGVDLSKPLVGVMGNPYIGKLAREVCGDEYTLVSLYYENKYCDYSLVDISPTEWAYIFSFFKLTFTSFFHGTIFSLKNGTPTITIEQNPDYSANYKTKTADLLENLGLSDYYFGSDRQNVDCIKEQVNKYVECKQADRIKSALEKESRSAEKFFNRISQLCER